MSRYASAGSRSVMVSSPNRATLLLLHERLPTVQLLYSADNFAAVERLRSDPALVAAVSGMSAYHGVVDATLLRWAHAHDLKVIAWTVNDGQQLAQLTRLGVDGITTANLAVLRSLGGRSRHSRAVSYSARIATVAGIRAARRAG